MTAPPLRYSVSQKDFDPAIGLRLLIRLDGVEQREVVEYDCEAGTVLRNERDEDGNLRITPDREGIVQELKSGVVTVEWID